MSLERLAVLLALVALVTGVTIAVRVWNARRIRSVLQASQPWWQTLGEAPDGRAELVQFSTPSCLACKQAQAPAVMHAQAQLGEERLRIIKVDAAQRPEIARAFGVLTVPSTVVLAPAGRVIAVNQGFAPAAKLVEQVQRT